MSKKTIIISICIVFFISGLFMVSNARDKNNSLRFTLGEELYQNCGLDKLEENEEQQLIQIIGHRCSRSFTQHAAEQYMEKQGWREVQVVGVVPTGDTFEKYWLLVSDNYELLTLDPFSVVELPPPGIYWARNNLSSWKILYPDAEEVSFIARELK